MDQVLLTGQLLHQKLKIFTALTKEDGAAELKLSNGWLDSVKVRTSLKHVKRHEEGQSFNIDHGYQERPRLQTILYDF